MMILVIGDIMLDILLLPELLRPEQRSGILVRGGGSAANTAAWSAYLGCAATFVGSVGRDAVGDILIRELEREGVGSSVRQSETLESGCVAVEVTAAGERLMRSSRGANVELAPELVILAGEREARISYVHLTGYALLSPHGLSILATAAEVARAHNATLSFDPSSESAVASLGGRDLLGVLERNGVGLLLPNRYEAAELTGRADPHEAAAALDGHIPTVIVKNGGEGAVWSRAGASGEVPTTPIAPVDTTGAGDAFDAGALVALSRGESIETACRQGNETARQAITQYGGRPPSPNPPLFRTGDQALAEHVDDALTGSEKD